MRNHLLFGLLICLCLSTGRAAAQDCAVPFLPVGAAVRNGNCYRLTQQGDGFSVAQVWATRTIDLTDDFDFTFNVNQCGGADGVVFVLQNAGQAATTGTDGAGMNLGYYQSPGQVGVFTHSVGIELDIYQNVGPPMNDPAFPHMAIALNGNPAPVAGPINIPELSNCHDHMLRITWVAATHQLSTQLDGVPYLSYSQDLVANIFGGNPTVWFGFTGSTGGSTATQTICPVALPVLPAPTAVAVTGSTTLCPGQTIGLSVPGQPAGTTYEWSPAAGLSATTSATVTAAPAVTTTYTVTVRPPNGCPLQGRTTLTVLGPLQLTVATPRFSTAGVILTATGGGPDATYHWSPAAGLNTTEGPTVIAATPTAATMYTVTATSAAGCTGQTIVVVPPFVLPNIITPNGDHLNDTFRPLVSLEPVTLQVFSRWGQPVFEQANYLGSWNAGSLAAGSYYFRLSTASGESWKGWVEVVR